MTHLGQRLRTLREQQSMTQKILASLVGVRQAAISRIENNDRFPSTEVLVKLAVVLGTSLDDLAPTVAEIQAKKNTAAVTS